MPTLHVHADEAGDLNFISGSKHFIYAVAWTLDPSPLATELQSQRFRWLKAGHDIPYFHAAPENPGRRATIANMMVAFPNWRFSAVVVQKAKLWPRYRKPSAFYPRFLESALSFVLKGSVAGGASRVLIYTDRLPNLQAAKAGIEKAIKRSCAAHLKPRGIPSEVFHHHSASNYWLQVADYCCWAVQRKYDWGDPTWYDLFRPRLHATELYLWP